MEMEFGRGSIYRGNYSSYEEQKKIEVAEREKQARLQADQREKIERFINRFRSNPKKRNLVQSRMKMLERMEVIETHRGHSRMRIRFPEVPRSPLKVIEASEISKRYDRVVFSGVDLLVQRGERIGIVGRNGEGKSTLSRLIAGIEEPTEGRVTISQGVLIGYYSQEVELSLSRDMSILEQLSSVSPESSEQQLRAFLGMFLFTGDDVFKRTSVLSGGEKSRIALARILLTPLNLLILDEPTNHLDIFSREVLEEALKDYKGTLVLISHDEHLLGAVVEKVFEVEGGSVRPFNGTFDYYLEKRHQALQELLDAPVRPEQSGPSQRDMEKDRKRREAEERNRLYKLRQRVERKIQVVEKDLLPLEEKLRAIEACLCDPSILADGPKVVELQKEHAWLADRTGGLQTEWDRLAAELEKIGS